MVNHVCSGNETELDISLDVLTDLVVLHTSLLMRYAIFVKVRIHAAVQDPYTTLPQIQNRSVLFRNRGNGTICTCKAVCLEKRICCEG